MAEENKDIELLLLCKCESVEHQIIVRSINKTIYLTIHLCKLPFWKRLKNAIKYLFGHTSKFGEFDEFIFKNSDYQKMYTIANFMHKNFNKN